MLDIKWGERVGAKGWSGQMARRVQNVQPKATAIPATVIPAAIIHDDRTTEGQRRVNLIWETTQAIIAIMVVAANMGTAVFNTVTGKTGDVPVILSSALFLVVGFYFARTNHQSIGGVAAKPVLPYAGR